MYICNFVPCKQASHRQKAKTAEGKNSYITDETKGVKGNYS